MLILNLSLLLSVPRFSVILRDGPAVNNREFNFALQFPPSGYFQVLRKVPVELTSFLNLISTLVSHHNSSPPGETQRQLLIYEHGEWLIGGDDVFIANYDNRKNF